MANNRLEPRDNAKEQRKKREKSQCEREAKTRCLTTAENGPSSSKIDPPFRFRKASSAPPRAQLLLAHFLRPTNDCNTTTGFLVPEQKSEAGRPRQGRERLGRGSRGGKYFVFSFLVFPWLEERADLGRIAPRDTAFKRRPGSSTARAGSSDQI